MSDLSYRAITPQKFFEELFGDVSQTAVFSIGGQQHGVWKETIAEINEESLKKENLYVYPATFFNDYPKRELLKNLHALVVDIDSVSDYGIDRLEQIWKEDELFAPTLVVESGTGLHLYYVLDKPVECRKRWQHVLNKVNKALYRWWLKRDRLGGLVDLHSANLPHAFRVPGSLTKSQEVEVKAYLNPQGKRTNLVALADGLGVSRKIKDEEETTFECFEDRERREGTERLFPRIKEESFGVRHRGLYDYTLQGIEQKTQVGNRYLSIFCLASLAWLCGIEKAELERDIRFLVEQYWRSKYRNSLDEHDIQTAMKGYDKRFAVMKKETREELLGWRYGPSPKRNKGELHRTRAEHIREVHKARKEESVDRILLAQVKYPGATKIEVARISGRSRSTVHRYWSIAMDKNKILK